MHVPAYQSWSFCPARLVQVYMYLNLYFVFTSSSAEIFIACPLGLILDYWIIYARIVHVIKYIVLPNSRLIMN